MSPQSTVFYVNDSGMSLSSFAVLSSDGDAFVCHNLEMIICNRCGKKQALMVINEFSIQIRKYKEISTSNSVLINVSVDMV